MNSNPPTSGKFKTCRRYNDAGHAHSPTFSCFHGKAFLSKSRTREWLIDALLKAREHLQFDLWAYVIMPEHCHSLLFPRRLEYSVSRILEAIKLPVTRRARSYLQRENPDSLRLMRDEQPNGQVAYRFWQCVGGYDRNLFEAEAIHAEIDYIHHNPVRRGLVARAEDWPWSSASWYSGKRDSLLVPDAGSVPTLHLS